jgi:peptidoglycan/LPS O-acetylase OafA/YrhL
MTQLLLIWGVAGWGLIPFTILSALLTAPVAILSWWLIEKHALRLKSFSLRTHARPIGIEAE